MFVQLACAALQGVNAFRVDLEVDILRRGLPAFIMVGLPEAAVREARERVFSALKNSGYKIPPCRITVNLAPADRKKEGTGYDLPLALGILAASGFIPSECLEGFFICGELSLAGDLKPVPGVLPMAALALGEKAKGIILPKDNAQEASAAAGLTVYAVENLGEAVAALRGGIEPFSLGPAQNENKGFEPTLDFAEVKGQEHAKRALEIAAAGGHNILFAGPPGSGKTMLAKRVPTIMPPLSFDEALEVTKVYSVSGLLARSGLVSSRPFRSPHHTISYAGLAGGGSNPKPGEISLAHNGVLFLDELPEFSRAVLETLRQPLEEGVVNISRAGIAISYPASFMLVAAMNPCPCGYAGDSVHPCTCSQAQIQNYRARISGPLLDRIDLHIEIPAVAYRDFKAQTSGLSSSQMKKNVLAARAIQLNRYSKKGVALNSTLAGNELEKFCSLSSSCHDFMENAANSLGLSARSCAKILRIARTIADLEACENISEPHLAEAINARFMDRAS